jgi:hypothetical protein
MNAIVCGACGINLAASGAAILANVQKAPEKDVAAWVFLLCAPLAGLAGWGAANLRFRHLAAATELPSPLIAELRVRALLFEVAEAAGLQAYTPDALRSALRPKKKSTSGSAAEHEAASKDHDSEGG